MLATKQEDTTHRLQQDPSLLLLRLLLHQVDNPACLTVRFLLYLFLIHISQIFKLIFLAMTNVETVTLSYLRFRGRPPADQRV